MSIPVITSVLTLTAVKGTAIANYTITASNTPTSFSATGLPTGLSIVTATGVISGTPTVSGVFNITINAINADGTGTATLVSTISDKPTVTATSTAIVFNGATITGTINPNSLGVTYAVEYGTTNAYGTTTATQVMVSGVASTAITPIVLTGLTPSTTYHYAIVATNADGTTTTADATFTTTSAQAAAQELCTEILDYLINQHNKGWLKSLIELAFHRSIISWKARLAAIIASEA